MEEPSSSLSASGLEKLIAKGYKFVIQFNEGDKPFGEPLTFKETKDIISFMLSYPSMKMVWSKDTNEYLKELKNEEAL